MASRAQRVAFRMTGLLIGLLFALGMLELGLRAIDWPVPGVYQDGRGPLALSTPDADGGSWRRYPGKARLRHWEYDVEVAFNPDGFIERDRVAKPPGVWRVGVFGDSFTAGLGVKPEERFSEIWIRRLAETLAPRSVEVYNFGSAWCGSAQNAAFLAAHGKEYDLDEIVLAVFGGNELADNEGWARHSALSPEERARVDAEASSGTSLRAWLRNHSRALGFLFVTVAGRFSSQAAHVSTVEDVAKSWKTTEAGLDAVVRAAGTTPLTLWYLPDSQEWDDEVWKQFSDGTALDAGDRHALRDAIASWARDRGVAFVDVTPILAGRSVRDLRFLRDGHWNAAGHALVGTALAQRGDASQIQRSAESGR